MGRCAAFLFTHLNVLLAVYGGAALATAARLKWDPTTWVALRELLPAEYRATAATLTALGCALLLLPNLALLALRCRHALRRALLYAYAALLCCTVLGELVFVWWTTRRILAWLASHEAALMAQNLQLVKSLMPALQELARWDPRIKHFELVLEEARRDAPINAYVSLCAGVLLCVGQLAALLLALVVASGGDHHHSGTVARYNRPASVEAPSIRYEKLRTAYKDGRIIIL